MTAPTAVERAAARLLRPVASGALDGMSIRAGGEEVTITPEMARRAQGFLAQQDDRLPFERAPEVQDVAQALIDRFPSFHHLTEWRLDYWYDNDPPKPGGGCQKIGRASVDNELLSARTGHDALVIVNRPWWMHADENAQQALVYHELSHLETKVDDAGGATLRTVRHDLEMFLGEAAHFGAWRHGIREVADQLSMFEDSTARP